MVKVNNKNTRTTSLVFLYFTPFSRVSIVNFEQVNVSWVTTSFSKKRLKNVISFYFIVTQEILKREVKTRKKNTSTFRGQSLKQEM